MDVHEQQFRLSPLLVFCKWYFYKQIHNQDSVFSELLREHGLVGEVPPWYLPVMPKPAYQNTTSEAFWDIPVYAEHNEVRANRIDA